MPAAPTTRARMAAHPRDGMAPRVLVFDFGNVLAHFSPLRAAEQLAAYSPLAADTPMLKLAVGLTPIRPETCLPSLSSSNCGDDKVPTVTATPP